MAAKLQLRMEIMNEKQPVGLNNYAAIFFTTSPPVKCEITFMDLTTISLYQIKKLIEAIKTNTDYNLCFIDGNGESTIKTKNGETIFITGFFGSKGFGEILVTTSNEDALPLIEEMVRVGWKEE